jgi:hypothetical protein
MKKAFMLRWATGDQIRIPYVRNGEWQLRFKGGAAHDFADKRLFREHWLSVKNSSEDEALYSFIDDGADLPKILQNLQASGIPDNEIEIDPSAGSQAAAKLSDDPQLTQQHVNRGEGINKDGDDIIRDPEKADPCPMEDTREKLL